MIKITHDLAATAAAIVAKRPDLYQRFRAAGLITSPGDRLTIEGIRVLAEQLRQEHAVRRMISGTMRAVQRMPAAARQEALDGLERAARATPEARADRGAPTARGTSKGLQSGRERTVQVSTIGTGRGLGSSGRGHRGKSVQGIKGPVRPSTPIAFHLP